MIDHNAQGARAPYQGKSRPDYRRVAQYTRENTKGDTEGALTIAANEGIFGDVHAVRLHFDHGFLVAGCHVLVT